MLPHDGAEGEQVRAGVFTPSLNMKKKTLIKVSKLLKPEPKLKLGYLHLRFVCTFFVFVFLIFVFFTVPTWALDNFLDYYVKSQVKRLLSGLIKKNSLLIGLVVFR